MSKNTNGDAGSSATAGFTWRCTRAGDTAASTAELYPDHAWLTAPEGHAARDRMTRGGALRRGPRAKAQPLLPTSGRRGSACTPGSYKIKRVTGWSPGQRACSLATPSVWTRPLGASQRAATRPRCSQLLSATHSGRPCLWGQRS